MKQKLQAILIGLAVSQSLVSQTVTTGPNSSQSPYVLPLVPGYSVTSILTTPDVIGGYTMCGIPDGMGAYDNNDGTFTLIMNHEIAYPGTNTGAVHAHGASGAFLSKWVINKTTLAVTSGADVIQNVNLWNPSTSTYSLYNSTNPSTLTAFSRFCSGDLSPVSAYYNSVTGRGTQSRIYMNGEESGNEGRLLAHVVTGPSAGTTYELPFLGKFSCENAVASPNRSDKTIVAGFDDTTPGQVYVYVGTKTSAGSDITKAGLTGGKLYGVAVAGLLNEVNASVPAANTTFSLVDLGQVQAITGTSLNTVSNNLGVTNFLRPEDGCWDPSNPRDLYFNTTNAFNSASRLWRLRFNDINNPELGGTITAVLDGTEGQQMLDNMTIDNSGHVMLVEDVGNNAWIGRVLEYNIATDVLTPIAQHDPARFVSGGANYLTQDEEASGIFDAQALLGPGKFIFVTQAHYAISGAPVEGGQLMVLSSVNTASSNPEINLIGNATSIPAGNSAISTSNNTDYGTMNTGVSQTRSFVIQNTGTGTLVVTGMNITGTNAGDFTFVNPPSFPLSIAPNGVQNITVNFNPPLTGARTAIINVYNNDFNESIYDFAVQGTGAVAEINIQGNNTNIPDGNPSASAGDNTSFGTIMTGSTQTRAFVIQNTGTGTLTVSGINISGTNASLFTMISPPAFPLSLLPNGSQSFTVQFSPTAIGSRTAMVNVNSSDSDESIYNFVIEGSGTFDVGINQLSSATSFATLFPTPTKDEAIVSISLEKREHVMISIIDIQGKQVGGILEKDLDNGKNQVILNTTELKNGIYFVDVVAGAKNTTIKMIVVH